MKTQNQSIPQFDLGGNGPSLHFLHANGYPPECYLPLFELIKTQYYLFGMKLRPLWPDSSPKEISDWKPLSDDLLRFLSNRGTDPVIGVGHSIGGIVTLRAALRAPQKFRAIILLDPVLFVPNFILMWNIVRALGLGNKAHPKIGGALKRRREFDNLDLIFRGYRTREVFKYMSDESLRAYILGITKEKQGGGFELAYSPEWEARIYLTGLRDLDIWHRLPKLEVPTLIIRGAETDTFLEAAAMLVKQKQPKVKIESLPESTHILPLEYPQKVFEIMQTFLNDL
ncbi:MAG TPA: alpha/beta hydrolase [Anaerolineales bacterium]|nr:alpha/beta hydrolase [Anaerolineales bacterium]